LLNAIMFLRSKEGRHEDVEQLWESFLARAKRFASSKLFSVRIDSMGSPVDENYQLEKADVSPVIHSDEPVIATSESSDAVDKVAKETIVPTEGITFVIKDDPTAHGSAKAVPKSSHHETEGHIVIDRSPGIDELWDTSPVGIRFDFSHPPQRNTTNPKIAIRPEPILPAVSPDAPRLWASRKRVLNYPLATYMRSIISERGNGARNKIHGLVMGLVEKGWLLDNETWNILVRGLITNEIGSGNVEAKAGKSKGTGVLPLTFSFSAFGGKSQQETLPLGNLQQEQEGREDALSATEKAFALGHPLSKARKKRRGKSTLQAVNEQLESSLISVPNIKPDLHLEPSSIPEPHAPAPQHILTAFRLTETLLIENFPGWIADTRPLTAAQKLGEWRGGFYWMNTQLWTGKYEKGREWLCPELETLLDLRDRLRSLASTSSSPVPSTCLIADPAHIKILETGVIPPDISPESVHTSVMLEAIELHAPRTLEAIRCMPLIKYPQKMEVDEKWALRVGWERLVESGSSWLLDQQQRGKDRGRG
jgi:hypothetical protein